MLGRKLGESAAGPEERELWEPREPMSLSARAGKESRRLFDYNSVLPNTRLVAQELTKRFNADLLFTYLLHPGTAVYIGYSDRRENLALDGRRRPGPPDLNAGRQVFIKLSYLVRF